MKDTNSLEQRILSTLLFKNEFMKETELNVDLFQYKAHKDIFMILQEEYKKAKKIDLMMIAEKLNEYKLLDYVMKIQDSYVGSSTFYSDLEKLSECRALEELKTLINKCENESLSFEELKSEIKKIDVINTQTNTENLSVDEIMALITSDDIQLKFTTLTKLNVFGIQKNALHVIGARTGVGKSAFALNLMNDLSNTYKCIYFNMEMTQKETLRRIVSMNANIPTNKYSELSETEKSNVYDTIYKMKSHKNFSIVNGSQSTGSIRKLISRESRDTHLIVFIDYVGLIKDRRFQNITQRVTELTKELQIMTKDFDCTIFLLAQLNREGGNDSKPRMEYLKDSGELEQSASTLMLLHRDSNQWSNTINYELFIPKNRNPKTGVVNLILDKEIQRFREE